MFIRQAHLADLDKIVPLFNGYRIFYKQLSDLAGARNFIEARFINNDSTIFLSFLDNTEQTATGFMQLYPLFSSVSMQPMLLLNDLYIDPEHRGQGIGSSLIYKAKQFCKFSNQKGLAIQTAHDNPAQKLYERLGFKKDLDLHYFWTLS